MQPSSKTTVSELPVSVKTEQERKVPAKAESRMRHIPVLRVKPKEVPNRENDQNQCENATEIRSSLEQVEQKTDENSTINDREVAWEIDTSTWTEKKSIKKRGRFSSSRYLVLISRDYHISPGIFRKIEG